MTAADTILYIGSRVTYHGSHSQFHGRQFILMPCDFEGECDHCDEACWSEDGPPERYSLIGPDGSALRHVRPGSVTADPHWRPADAIEIPIARFCYLACHTTPGGSPTTRIVHFHTADGQGGTTWCFFHGLTDQIRRLDTANCPHRSLTPAAQDQARRAAGPPATNPAASPAPPIRAVRPPA